jgi:16S rRNA processing protein RimM
MSAEEKIIVGKITGVYGVKGWVKVFSWTEPKDNITGYSPWYIKHPDASDWQQVKLESAKPHGKTVVAKIEGIDDRNEALLLNGLEIAIDESQIKPLGEDEFYWRELLGLRVENRQGIVLGTVQELLETGANDVLVVQSEQGKQHLIPFVAGAVVLTVDLPGQSIQVDWEESWSDD